MTQFLRVPPYEILVSLMNFIFFGQNEITNEWIGWEGWLSQVIGPLRAPLVLISHSFLNPMTFAYVQILRLKKVDTVVHTNHNNYIRALVAL